VLVLHLCQKELLTNMKIVSHSPYSYIYRESI
jgi:hypothetical protein